MKRKIAISGLGKMGMQMVRKLREAGYEVIAHDINEEAVRNAAMLYGAISAIAKEQVVRAFEGAPVVMIMMVPADTVDTAILQWLAILPKESILIDGGNSRFTLTEARITRAREKGVYMLGMGTSGGVWGYTRGFCIMVGGDKTAFQTIEPVLAVLTKPTGSYLYCGEGGRGHFVKMVHNAIEYGMMQSIAEGVQMLKEGQYKDLNLPEIFELYRHNSVISSWLVDLTAEALKENPELAGIEGVVAESGEAKWALEAAKEFGIGAPSIQASLDVRIASQKGKTSFATKVLAAMRNKFGGHNIQGK